MIPLNLKIPTEEKSLAEQFADLDEDRQIEFLERLYHNDRQELKAMRHSWRFLGRPHQQLPPDNEWDTLFCTAGRGSGKTRMAAEIVHQWAENRNWHLDLVGETAAEVRDVMVEGPSGLAATQKPWNPIIYMPSKRRIIWPKTGTWATLYSGDAPDQLRGPNSHKAWVDELAKFKYPDDTMANLDMVLRAGQYPQKVITTTPRPIKIIKELAERAKHKSERVIKRIWSTFRNFRNVAPRFLENMLRRYAGTRLGRQELEAEILEDTEGALWRLSVIEELRVNYSPHMSNIVVGVDPPISVGGECGIVVLGLSGEDIYCIDDMSISGLPEQWGNQVVSAFNKYDADMIVPETNQGGDMVISTIRAISASVPIQAVHASRGKRTRAEPISTFTERKKVHHIGAFKLLEDELTTWVPGEDSPNRMDAYVHGATYLLNLTPYGMRSKQAGVLF